jgi:acetyltransferase-like isoleucine patch superfamily enzyme
MISRDVEIAPNVRLGDYSYVNAGTVIGSGSVGKYCSIGYFCQIGLPEHPISLLSTSPRLYGEKNIFALPPAWNDESKPPQIGNDVWIASSVIVLRGVTIGDGAVIGAGAVVTRNVEPYAICVGVPSRMIGKRFAPEKIDMLLRRRWWDLSKEELLSFCDEFCPDVELQGQSASETEHDRSASSQSGMTRA